MTMPHLMNCPHSAEGWCLDCVVAQGNKLIEVSTYAEQLKREAAKAYLALGAGDVYEANLILAAMDAPDSVHLSIQSNTKKETT